MTTEHVSPAPMPVSPDGRTPDVGAAAAPAPNLQAMVQADAERRCREAQHAIQKICATYRVELVAVIVESRRGRVYRVDIEALE